MRTAPAALALALLLTGCSSSGDDGEAAAAPSPTAEGGSFASTGDIVTALNSGGMPCEEPQTGSYEGVTEAQSCIVNDSEDVVLLRFADDAEKQEYLETKDELASVVVGQDWAVQTVLPQTAEQVAAAIGGEVRPGATS